jgi:hypothetical protein
MLTLEVALEVASVPFAAGSVPVGAVMALPGFVPATAAVETAAGER